MAQEFWPCPDLMSLTECRAAAEAWAASRGLALKGVIVTYLMPTQQVTEMGVIYADQ